MYRQNIPYSETGFYNKLVIDYTTQKSELMPFYNRYNSVENYLSQIEEKQQHPIDRSLLVNVLKEQNASITLSSSTSENIDHLESPSTFTITTGHQLCLFLGPLYVIYKIMTAINLATLLSKTYPNYRFVPVFWMASEDHDFEEINHINAFGRKIHWDNQFDGAVGKMKLANFSQVLNELQQLMGEGPHAQRLAAIFKLAYSTKNLAQATRYLINEFFGQDGLVILDGDHPKLKAQFSDVMKKDIVDNIFYPLISKQSELLSKGYHKQAHVRKVNFFSLARNQRKRITTPISEDFIEHHPHHFSPNVLMRPLYQEMILPNLAYVGGGAEIAYWMQLKTVFEYMKVPFPILGLRKSALLLSTSQVKKIDQLGLSSNDLFKMESDLHKSYVLSQGEINVSQEMKTLNQLFDDLKHKFSDVAHLPIINAEFTRQTNAFEKMYKKLIRVEKQNHQAAISQISKLKSNLFPNNGLQERYDNFIPYYLVHGDNFMKTLKVHLKPLDTNFVVLEL